MLSLVSGSAVQLRNLIAVHIHQLCHRETGQQSLEAIVRASSVLAVLVLQGGDLIQIRLCTLRRQGTERFSFLLSDACVFSLLYGSGLSASTVS